MAQLLLLLTLIILALPAAALDHTLSSQASPKPVGVVVPPPAANEVIRQGGDTFDDAFPIDNLLFTSTGTTTGYTDDYDEACPYTGSTSPDVVYVYETSSNAIPCEYASIDLCGSSYDTKLYVYDSQQNLMACNDDYYYGDPCGSYVSRIDMAEFFQGETYYIVIDGYGGDHGEYILSIDEYACCHVYCPTGFWDEGEPPLEDDVPDTYNCGCDCDGTLPAIPILPTDANGALDICGRMGWTTVGGEVRRDTDWMSFVIGATGVVEGEFEDSLGSTIRVITPGDCADLEVQQTIVASPCYPNPLTIAGTPGDEVWIQVETWDHDPACGGYTPQEWEYTLQLSGMQVVVPIETQSWSSVKSMFR